MVACIHCAAIWPAGDVRHFPRGAGGTGRWSRTDFRIVRPQAASAIALRTDQTEFIRMVLVRGFRRVVQIESSMIDFLQCFAADEAPSDVSMQFCCMCHSADNEEKGLRIASVRLCLIDSAQFKFSSRAGRAPGLRL
jgi:hypothetical protein